MIIKKAKLAIDINGDELGPEKRHIDDIIDRLNRYGISMGFTMEFDSSLSYEERPDPITTLDTHPLWNNIKKYFIVKNFKLNGGRPKILLDKELEIETKELLLDIKLPCIVCSKELNPIQYTKLDKESIPEGLFFRPYCKSCSRKSSVTLELRRMAEIING